MKHCPECNFHFADFHSMCDFDGTELVKDPEQRALIKVKAPPPPSRFRRTLDSSTFWTCLLLSVLLSSVFVVAYYEATNRPASVVKDQTSPPSPSVARASEQSPALNKTPVPSKRAGSRNLNILPRSSSASLRRQATAPRSLARLPERTSIGNRSVSEPRADRGPRAGTPRVVVDATGSRRDARAGERRQLQISDKKEPKLTAMLKTTWRVLKRPFKF